MNSFVILYYWLIFLINHVPGTFSMDDGDIAAPGKFKYFVSIWYGHDYLCGGVIIDKRHVLTVGHCVYDIPSSDIWIVAGITKLSDKNMNMLKINRIWFHPHSSQVIDFVEPNRVYWTNDVAIIRVADDWVYSSTVGPVTLLSNVRYWNRAENCEIPGWKMTMVHGRKEASLRWTRGRLLTKEQYLQLNKNPLPNTEYITVPVLLNKDSGNPLICDDIMTGFVVQEGRTTDEPSTVLKIDAYEEFITAVLTNGDANSNLNELAIVVSVWYKQALVCGGVVIDSTRILTASHCIPKLYQTRYMFISYTNTLNGSPEAVFVSVANVRRHENYMPVREDYDHFFYTKQNDIAVLQLTQSLQWSESLRPAVFIKEESTSSLYCHTFRWRFDESDIPSQLIWSSVTLIDSVNVLLIPNQFVIADADSRSSSHLKDNGNPVICNGMVVGIVVNSLMNTADWSYEPTIVLDIIPYIDFIKSTLSESSQSSLSKLLEF